MARFSTTFLNLARLRRDLTRVLTFVFCVHFKNNSLHPRRQNQSTGGLRFWPAVKRTQQCDGATATGTVTSTATRTAKCPTFAAWQATGATASRSQHAQPAPCPDPSSQLAAGCSSFFELWCKWVYFYFICLLFLLLPSRHTFAHSFYYTFASLDPNNPLARSFSWPGLCASQFQAFFLFLHVACHNALLLFLLLLPALGYKLNERPVQKALRTILMGSKKIYRVGSYMGGQSMGSQLVAICYG